VTMVSVRSVHRTGKGIFNHVGFGWVRRGVVEACQRDVITPQKPVSYQYPNCRRCVVLFLPVPMTIYSLALRKRIRTSLPRRSATSKNGGSTSEIVESIASIHCSTNEGTVCPGLR
jgi:hypothetical protein